MSSLEFGSSVTGCYGPQQQFNTNNQCYISFPHLCAKLTSMCFQHHKKLLQAGIYVCTPKCVSHVCENWEILHTFKSPKFLGLCLDSVWDMWEGHTWRTETMASVRAGTQWGGWMKMQEELRKNCLNCRGHENLGSGWREVAGLCLCSSCVSFGRITQSRSYSFFHFRSLMAVVFSASELQ